MTKKAEVIISSYIEYDSDRFFVDRIGKFGSRTYECGSYTEAVELADKIALEPHVLFVNIWN